MAPTGFWRHRGRAVGERDHGAVPWEAFPHWGACPPGGVHVLSDDFVAEAFEKEVAFWRALGCERAVARTRGRFARLGVPLPKAAFRGAEGAAR